jgi:hypothetical protein
MTNTAPEDPRTAAELRSAISTLEDQLSEHARAGTNDRYASTIRQLNATKQELTGAERRELAEAAAAHRLKQSRQQSGMDTDGSLRAAGYATAGDAIADRLRSGVVTTANLEYLVREAVSKAQKRA